jgi:hypothetical protein
VPDPHLAVAAGNIIEKGAGVDLLSDGDNIDHLFVCKIAGHFKQGMYSVVIVTLTARRHLFWIDTFAGLCQRSATTRRNRPRAGRTGSSDRIVELAHPDRLPSGSLNQIALPAPARPIPCSVFGVSYSSKIFGKV